ncbi:MAG: PIG-L family deacetylase [Clostridium sp.]|nr:PIG-L family deacetylase [Clostridium sp.]
MIDKLLVTAHPDDEMIFAGDKLLREKGWKVVCITNGTNMVRNEEFKKAMKKAKVSDYEIWNYKDEWKGDFPREELKDRLEKVISSKNYKIILSHNLQGEYGHSQHKALAEVLREIVKENLYEFSLGENLSFFRRIRKWKILMKYKSERKVVLSKEVRQYVLKESMKKVK